MVSASVSQHGRIHHVVRKCMCKVERKAGLNSFFCQEPVPQLLTHSQNSLNSFMRWSLYVPTPLSTALQWQLHFNVSLGEDIETIAMFSFIPTQGFFTEVCSVVLLCYHRVFVFLNVALPHLSSIPWNDTKSAQGQLC